MQIRRKVDELELELRATRELLERATSAKAPPKKREGDTHSTPPKGKKVGAPGEGPSVDMETSSGSTPQRAGKPDAGPGLAMDISPQRTPHKGKKGGSGDGADGMETSL